MDTYSNSSQEDIERYPCWKRECHSQEKLWRFFWKTSHWKTKSSIARKRSVRFVIGKRHSIQHTRLPHKESSSIHSIDVFAKSVKSNHFSVHHCLDSESALASGSTDRNIWNPLYMDTYSNSSRWDIERYRYKKREYRSWWDPETFVWNTGTLEIKILHCLTTLHLNLDLRTALNSAYSITQAESPVNGVERWNRQSESVRVENSVYHCLEGEIVFASGSMNRNSGNPLYMDTYSDPSRWDIERYRYKKRDNRDWWDRETFLWNTGTLPTQSSIERRGSVRSMSWERHSIQHVPLPTLDGWSMGYSMEDLKKRTKIEDGRVPAMETKPF